VRAIDSSVATGIGSADGVERRHAGELTIPLDLRACRPNDLDRRANDFRTDPVTGDQRDGNCITH